MMKFVTMFRIIWTNFQQDFELQKIVKVWLTKQTKKILKAKTLEQYWIQTKKTYQYLGGKGGVAKITTVFLLTN